MLYFPSSSYTSDSIDQYLIQLKVALKQQPRRIPSIDLYRTSTQLSTIINNCSLQQIAESVWIIGTLHSDNSNNATLTADNDLLLFATTSLSVYVTRLKQLEHAYHQQSRGNYYSGSTQMFHTSRSASSSCAKLLIGFCRMNVTWTQVGPDSLGYLLEASIARMDSQGLSNSLYAMGRMGAVYRLLPLSLIHI